MCLRQKYYAALRCLYRLRAAYAAIEGLDRFDNAFNERAMGGMVCEPKMEVERDSVLRADKGHSTSDEAFSDKGGNCYVLGISPKCHKRIRYLSLLKLIFPIYAAFNFHPSFYNFTVDSAHH